MQTVYQNGKWQSKDLTPSPTPRANSSQEVWKKRVWQCSRRYNSCSPTKTDTSASQCTSAVVTLFPFMLLHFLSYTFRYSLFSLPPLLHFSLPFFPYSFLLYLMYSLPLPFRLLFYLALLRFRIPSSSFFTYFLPFLLHVLLLDLASILSAVRSLLPCICFFTSPLFMHQQNSDMTTEHLQGVETRRSDQQVTTM